MSTHTPPGAGTPKAINGASWDATVSITANSTTTDAVLFEGYAMGSYDVPSGSSLTSITWYAYNYDTPLAANDEDVVAVTQTVAASKHIQLPTGLAGSKYICPVGDTTGTIYLHIER